MLFLYNYVSVPKKNPTQLKDNTAWFIIVLKVFTDHIDPFFLYINQIKV